VQSLFEKDIDARFADFHNTNPQVFELFVKFAREWKAKGHQRGSAEAIMQRIRWEVATQTHGDKFKVNDHFRARYARLLVEKFPEFEGFFEFRKNISVDEAA